jgi:hypothetical protein
LLGSLFGGGEELSFVSFDPGQTLIADSARQRLDQLGKALLARQSLHLEITGKADAVSDADGVRAGVLERRLQEAKWRDALKRQKRSGLMTSHSVKKNAIVICRPCTVKQVSSNRAMCWD